MYVCLWSPAWSTAGASAAEGSRRRGSGRHRAAGESTGGAGGSRSAGDDAPSSYDVAPLLAELAPRLRVEREVIWADGRGLDAGRLAEGLLGRLAEEGVRARAGVAAVPITAELAARWGPRGETGPEGPTPFLVKERTGWGHRASSPSPRSPEGPGPAAATPGLAPPEGGFAPDPTPPGGGGDRPAPAAPPEGGGASSRSAPRSGGGGGERRPPGGGGVVVVAAGWEREWQSVLPVSALRPPDRTRTLFDGVGLKTVGELASLAREAVEVRFGGDAVALWRSARAEDRRLLFDRIPRGRPHGSVDFVDYVLTDPSRLLFTANALLGPLCDGLTARGEHARTLRLELPLANGEEWARTLRPARPTASRDTWLRLIRGLLDRLTVPDAVVGMRLEVPSTEAAAVRQGDLFDRGFATASAVEAAVARLAERQLWPVAPETDGHPLVERRGDWKRLSVPEAVSHHTPDRPGGGAAAGGLALQLLETPRRLTVETVARRDHEVPVWLRDRSGWREVTFAAGPDRISGGQWQAASYAREYYRCVTDQGVLLWIFRDALDGGWYLHGWWD